MKRKQIIRYGGIALGVILLLSFIFSGSEDGDSLSATAEYGMFSNDVAASGELIASSSEKIMGPADGMRSVGIWSVNITDLIDEGTAVDSGDYIATLDRDEIGTKLKENEIEVQKAQSVYIQTKLDTSLKLREARNELANLKFAMEEAKIVVEESEFEPPATIRKNEIAYDKAKIQYEQTQENFVLKRKQFEAKMQEAQATLDQVLKKQERIISIMDKFVIKAPKSGVLIYSRNWDGKKIVVGSRINAWNPIVAELPNLTQMKSRTYVNEVDIGKVKEDQVVEIGLDGVPGKTLTGKVEYVATIGEQLSNVGAKVFEVSIVVDQSDSTLLPGMSTSNKIIVENMDSVLLIPLECIFTEDSANYVFVKGSYSVDKVEVKTGQSNQNFIVVEEGLEEGDEVLFQNPETEKEES